MMFFDELERLLLELVMGEWFWRGGSPLQDFADAKTAERFVSSGLSGVRLICDARFLQRKYGTCFDAIEAAVLKRLKKYQCKFIEENELEIEKVFSDFIGEWILQIESERGYTRICVERDIELLRLQGRDILLKYNQTWKQAVQSIIRQDTFALASEGYAPHWLSELEKIPQPNW